MNFLFVILYYIFIIHFKTLLHKAIFKQKNIGSPKTVDIYLSVPLLCSFLFILDISIWPSLQVCLFIYHQNAKNPRTWIFA